MEGITEESQKLVCHQPRSASFAWEGHVFFSSQEGQVWALFF